MSRLFILLTGNSATEPPTIEPLFPRNHRTDGGCCGRCGEDVGRIALPELAYTWEVCDCGTPTYAHLVEQPWHRDHVSDRTAWRRDRALRFVGPGPAPELSSRAEDPEGSIRVEGVLLERGAARAWMLMNGWEEETK